MDRANAARRKMLEHGLEPSNFARLPVTQIRSPCRDIVPKRTSTGG